ncbi:MAG TPA: sialidase family protein [Gaiellales bacterium]|jgi:hypothetical protein
MRRSWIVFVVLMLVSGAFATVAVVRDGNEGPHAAAGRAGSNEIDADSNITGRRLDALNAAKTNGRFGGGVPSTTSPASGWVGSRLLNAATDDWEPAVAADPRAPYVYMLTTRYGQPKTCSSHCPTPFLALTVSSDGGSTWSPEAPICICEGAKAQYDPTIEVVPGTGAVYASFLNADRTSAFSAVFMKSTDHGRTWSTPVHVYGNVAWTDKPELAMSATGKDVFVSWNGPQGGDLYVGQSHDSGATWTQQQLTSDKRYYYAYDGRVLQDGTVVFSESSLVYSGSKVVGGEIWHHAIISRDNGANWQNVVVAKVPVGEPCTSEGCGPDFYTGQTSVVTDGQGDLVFAYEGPGAALGPQRVYISVSTDEGRTWSAGQAVSANGENATGPRLASSGSGGDARIWYMQTSGGDGAGSWNVWYRSSQNGGRSWSSPVEIDDAPAGATGYVNARGFDEIYGDYGEMSVTSAGKSIAVWGEGFSYLGPGGTWFNVQR